MNKRVMGELLDAYANGLIAVGDLPHCPDELTDLFRLTDGIAALLLPVAPSAEFIQQLGAGLAAAATPPEIIIAQPSSKKLWLWLGAILSGSLVSAAGVLLLLFMRRGRRTVVAAG